MKTAKILFRAASILVLLASLLSVSGASASVGTPVSGEQTLFFEPISDRLSRLWTSNGWTHEKYYQADGTFELTGAAISLSGSVSRTDFYKADARGNGRVQGVITYTYVDNGTEVTCQGPSKGVLTKWALAGSVLAHCSDGSTLHGSIQDTGVVFDSNVPPNVIGVITAFSGTLVVPGR